MNDTNNDQDIQRLRSVKKSISQDPSKIKEYIKLISSEDNEDYIVPMAEINTLLNMISSSYNIKLDTITESFLVKFSNSDEIQLQDFLDHLILCLDKQEKIVASFQIDGDNLNLEKNNSSNLNNNNVTEKLEKKDFDFQEGKVTSINLNNLNETDDLYLMILHRSLYILKKKFDLNQEEIKKIYENFSDKNKFNKLLDTEKFVEVLDKIFKLCKINFLDIQYPSDLFKAEIVEEYSEEKLNMVERQIKNFMIKNRKNFNDKFKYKKAKEFYDKFLNDKSEFAKHSQQAGSPNNKSQQEKEKEKEKLGNGSNSKANKLNESNANLNESKISNVQNPKMNESKTSKISKADPKAKDSKAKGNATAKKGTNKAKESSKSLISNNSANKNNNNEDDKKAQIEELNSKLPKFEDKENNNKEFNNFNKGNFNSGSGSGSFNINDDSNNVTKNLEENSSPKFQGNFSSGPDAINNLEDFKIRKLDEEIKTFYGEDLNSNNKEKPKKFIISDAIPLIIAEFIHENINIAILDMSEDLKSDLRGLFDKDIIKKIEDNANYNFDSENALKMKEYLYEKLNTEKNIKTYEDLLLTKKTQGENTSHILNILEKLRHHLAIIERKIKESQLENEYGGNKDNKGTLIDNVLDKSGILNKTNNQTNNLTRNYNYKSKIIPKKKTKEDLRMENLNSIFDFYAKQNIFQPKTATFVEIQEHSKIIVLSEYVKFASDFNFPLKRDIVVEAFKKNAVNGRELKFDGFMKSLEKIAQKVNDEKIRTNLQKIKRIRTIGNGTNLNNNSNKNSNNQNPNSNTNNYGNNINNNNMGNPVEAKTINIQSKKKQEDEKTQNGTNNNTNYNNNNNEENGSNENNEINSQLDENNNNPNEEINNTEDNLMNNNIQYPSNNNNNNPNNTDNTNNNNNLSNNNFEDNNNLSEKNEEEITAIRKQIFEMKKRTQQELMVALYEFMEVDDPKNLQKRMKGYINAFRSDKMTRIEDGMIKGIIKFDAATSENVKRILKERKDQKLKEQEEKEKLEKLKKEEEKKKIHLRQKSNEKNIYYEKKPQQKYADIQKKHNNIIKEKETKLTWDQIEHLNFNHFITNREDDFNPNDLFDQGYDSDYENIFDVSNIGEKHGGNYSTSKTKGSQISNLNINNNSTNPINIQMSMNLPQGNNNLNNLNNNSYLINHMQNKNLNNNYNNNYNNLDTISDEQNKMNIRNAQEKYYDNRNTIAPNNNNSVMNNLKNHERKNSDIYGSIYSNGNNNRYNSNNSRNSNSNRSYQEDISSPSNINRSIDRSRNNNRNSPKGRNNNNNNNPKGKNLGGSNNNNNNKNYNKQIQRNGSPRSNNNLNASPQSKNGNNNNGGNNYSNMYSANNNNRSKIANIEKTEKLAREMEKNRANKSAKLINRNEDMIKKSIDKIKKYL